MRRRLILHIGTHKTGSSALQQHLALNRGALRGRGVLYPRPVQALGLLGSVHRDLRDTCRLDAEGDDEDGSGGARAVGDVDALLDAYEARIEASGAEVAILSAEGLSGADGACAAVLQRLGEHHDVRVIAFVRRTDYYLESFYRQHIKNQGRLHRVRFRGYARWRLEHRLRDLPQGFARWEEAFGPGALSVIPYEPAVSGFDVIDRFAEAAGIADRLRGLRRWRTVPVNASLSRSQAEFIRRANREGARLSRLQIALLRRFANDGGVYLGRKSRRRLVAQTEDELEEIRRRFVRDGRGRMFPAPPEREPAQTQDWNHRLDPAFERRMRRLLLLPPPADS